MLAPREESTVIESDDLDIIVEIAQGEIICIRR